MKAGGPPTRVGDRVQLIHTSDPYTLLETGDTGTVAFIDDLGTIHVNWDSGSLLGLVARFGDRWQTIQPEEDTE